MKEWDDMGAFERLNEIAWSAIATLIFGPVFGFLAGGAVAKVLEVRDLSVWGVVGAFAGCACLAFGSIQQVRHSNGEPPSGAQREH